ncbi:DUF4345 family protein [Cognatiyoonia sp. IB215446]|uniref:DUF4345 family protein n=1 Tax=Cognatiyoonia sp. IB215446 TaxID=3097355 RepID=UPI002A0B935E|nr:DUF4345 family protein [Cognatiyoonia sp. IB215446]MDX8347964.1 DUF4345 family protein [Cognatiyoonia sp. IB215446]
MDFTLQILVGLATVTLLGLGTMSMFAPRRMVKNFAIEPVGTAGLSTIRSVIGGLFITSVALLIFGLLTGQTLGFVVVALLLGIVAFGRIVGIVADGFDKAVIPPLVVELVIITVLMTAYVQLPTLLPI